LLPRAEYKGLLAQLDQIDLNFGSAVYEAGDIIRHVYFPTAGIVSLLATDGKESNLEIGVVGREGMIGLPVFMDVRTSSNLAVVQGAGAALRMNATTFKSYCDSGGSLPKLLQRYSHSLMTQLAQSVLCNRYHQINARLARWLLMTRDRMGTDEFQLTQEFLSNMLGVRREGVNKAAGNLQRQELISYNRGLLTITNGKGLEAVSCGCYAITRKEYGSFLTRK